MDEKIEVFNEAIIEKAKEIDNEIIVAKENKEKKIESLTRDKEELEKELSKPGLEKYISEEYQKDLEKVNNEIEMQENILEEKLAKLEKQKNDANKEKNKYSKLHEDKKDKENEIERNNRTIEKLQRDKGLLEKELDSDKLEGYIREEYKQDLEKINKEIESIIEKNNQIDKDISKILENISNLEEKYKIEPYVEKVKPKDIDPHDPLENHEKNEEKGDEVKENTEENEEKDKTDDEEEKDEKSDDKKETEGKNKKVTEKDLADIKRLAEIIKAYKEKESQKSSHEQNKEVIDKKNEKQDNIEKNIKITMGENGLDIQVGTTDKDMKTHHIDIDELKVSKIDEKYLKEIVKSSNKLGAIHKDSIDHNLLIGINKLKDVMSKDSVENIMRQYIKTLDPKANPKDIDEFNKMINVTYDRTNVDYLKPSNIVKRIKNRDFYDDVRYYADIAEECNIGKVEKDKPGKIRQFLYNIKNKVKLLGKGKEEEKTEEKTEEQPKKFRDEPKNADEKALLEATEKRREGKVDYQGRVSTGIIGKAEDLVDRLDYKLADKEDKEFYEDMINENKHRVEVMSDKDNVTHISIKESSDGTIKTSAIVTEKGRTPDEGEALHADTYGSDFKSRLFDEKASKESSRPHADEPVHDERKERRGKQQQSEEQK